MADNDFPKPRLRVYLIRHGEVEFAEERRLNGHKDVRLSETGEAEMLEVAEALSHRAITAIYSSDLYRCKRGAEHLAEKTGLKVNLVPAIREIDFGEVEGLGWKEALEKMGGAPARMINWVDNRFPGGENLLEFRERVIPAYRKIIEQSSGEIAMFAHGGTNRMVLCEELGIDLKNFFTLDQGYACVNIIEYFTVGFKMIRLVNGHINCVPALGEI